MGRIVRANSDREAVEKRVAAAPDDPRGRNEHAFVMQKLAARLAAELARSQVSDADTLVDVARVYAICAGSADSEVKSPAAGYADRAVDALAAAIKLQPGVVQGSSFQPDFASIAGHPRLVSVLRAER